MARYKLKLKSLKFISAVDTPAQETATAVLFKRAGGDGIKATVRAIKTSSDELGLVFGWAFTMKANGVDYHDLQGDNITEEDLIKVCAEYLADGGKTDAMHDRNPDGEVVFAWPLTAEVAKSFGIETDTTGLMIAVRPSPEVFAKFKSGELTGWSIDGIGEREAVKSAPVRKLRASLVTDVIDGHQHQVCVWDNGEMYVQSATMEGAAESHSHGIVRGENGALTILIDSGHSHSIVDGPSVVVVAPTDVVVVQASAKSTHQKNRPIVGSHTETNMSNTDADKTIADLTKRAQRLESIVKLAPDARAYFDTLADGGAQDDYLAKPAAEKSAIAKAAREADETVEYGGQVISKTANPGMFAIAKQAKADAEKNAAEIAKRDLEIEKADITKRTKETFGQLAGPDEVREYIFRSVVKGGGTAEQVGAAIQAMKGWAAETNVGKPAAGASGSSDAVVTKMSAFASLEKGLLAFCKTSGIAHTSAWTVGLDKFKATDEGAALKRAYDEAVAG